MEEMKEMKFSRKLSEEEMDIYKLQSPGALHSPPYDNST